MSLEQVRRRWHGHVIYRSKMHPPDCRSPISGSRHRPSAGRRASRAWLGSPDDCTICRNVRCEAPRERGSNGEHGSPITCNWAHQAPIRHHCRIAFSEDGSDGRIDCPISHSSSGSSAVELAPDWRDGSKNW